MAGVILLVLLKLGLTEAVFVCVAVAVAVVVGLGVIVAVLVVLGLPVKVTLRVGVAVLIAPSTVTFWVFDVTVVYPAAPIVAVLGTRFPIAAVPLNWAVMLIRP